MLTKSTNVFIVQGVSCAFVLLLLFPGCADSPHKFHSRLNNASSPYLLEHADNPVDWYEWGDEALVKAKKENKPLLISIGYASCHWCHVMEEESFMDTAVSQIMNDNFICIKVDREERPDIDNIYMSACQLLSGTGGWPLNAFALPDGKPFFAGTYYSKKSWINLLTQVSQAYREKNELVVKQAVALTKGIVDEGLTFSNEEKGSSVFGKDDYRNLFDSIYSKTDKQNGGIKGYPKFPMPSVIEFLLQHYYLTGNRQALDAATNTLTRMALGGIYDHVGGGFARYSVDSLWHVPHFEKMLYDNGQLISVYAHAYQLTQNDFFKNILTETISFVDRELTSPEGGLYSSLNADTRDGEGAFYSWGFDEFKTIAAGQPGELVAEYYDISPQGNWEKNRNILFASRTPGEYAAMKRIKAEEFSLILNKARAGLLVERNKRTKPATDKKILTGWNAIMLKGYADAYTATGKKEYLEKALTVAKFIEKNMMSKDRHLWRNYNNKKATIDAFLDDYAWTANSYIRLYQVTFDKHWLTLAMQLTDYAIANFFDTVPGMFYYTSAASPGLAVRKIETADNATPSSNAIMAGVLYDLAIYFDNKEFADKSAKMFLAMTGKMSAMPAYHAQWCRIAGVVSYGTYEIAIMGRDARVKNLELQRNYLPSCVYLGETNEENLPLLANKLSGDKTMIYVCTNKVCKMPVEDVNSALSQIN